MVRIVAITADGIADTLGLRAGDAIVQVNDRPVRDFLDVLLAEELEEVDLIVERADGELWQLEIEKEAQQPFGFDLEHPDPAHCGNNCLFCFVHQLPKGMRRTLYVKDEDYRFSFLYGAYITLTNLGENDIERIISQHLSPLYVSVHAVNEDVRARLLGRTAPPVLPILQRLVTHGIEVHSQVVVCPGVNDAEVLVETVEALYRLHPGVKSLALVPVGLTEHRRNLPPLQPVTPEGARDVLSRVADWQSDFLQRGKSRFVFAADEFYLRGDVAIPPLADYEELPQIENGVGKIALFREEADAVLDEAAEIDCPVEFTVVTGMAFAGELEGFLAELSALLGCRAHCRAIVNRLFGHSVTVAGLVSGTDIASQLAGQKLGSALFVPDVMMRDGSEHFLDDMTPTELSTRLGCPVRVIEDTPWGLLDAIEELAADL